MKRVQAKKGLLTCWSCGSSNVDVINEGETNHSMPYDGFPFCVMCDDCGQISENFETEALAKKAWNKAYALHVD